MTCPTSYVNSTPEFVPVTITNNTITLSMNSYNLAWVVDRFVLADSVGDAGEEFFLTQAATSPTEIQVYFDNVHQEYLTAYTVGPGSGHEKIILHDAMTAGSVLIVRYLAFVNDDYWFTETLRLPDSVSGSGAQFILSKTHIAGKVFVLLDGVVVAEGVGAGKYQISVGQITLGTPLFSTYQQLVVTYAYDNPSI